MQRFISTKSLAAATLVAGALGAASVAHARSNVYFSIGVQPAAVYAQPVYSQPVYSQPVYSQPVYVQPATVYVQPQPVYAQPYYGGYRHHRHYQRAYGPYGDLDRDGVMNQADRDRDGDGVRNRYDRFPDNPYRN